MDIERLKELKLAVGVVFQHWLDTAANQKGFDNTDSKKFFEHDAEHIQEILDEAIARQTVENWVSVEDRLPDGDVASVLIYTNKGGVSEGQYYPSIKSWKQFRWSVENADVTHWKPLPAPPKERFGSLLEWITNEKSQS